MGGKAFQAGKAVKCKGPEVRRIQTVGGVDG